MLGLAVMGTQRIRNGNLGRVVMGEGLSTAAPSLVTHHSSFISRITHHSSRKKNLDLAISH
jgi:hypothetical protein